MVVVPHWSATKFMTWDQCPGEFKARYVDDRPVELTEAMAFGQAVHMGLEAHYGGVDGIKAFRAAWREMQRNLNDVDENLTRTGMDLLEQVFELDLSGIPERGFSIDTNERLGAPVIGAIDLWGNDGVTYDFKTTRGLWSQERAQKELWQPAIYSWARWEQEVDYGGEFEYVVMNRVSGVVQRFRRDWTPEDLVAQMNQAWERMLEIASDVRADRYECHGKHGYCPECGDRWGHDHVCDVRTTERVRLHGRVA